MRPLILRLLFVALVFVSASQASDNENHLRKSVPVSTATRLTFYADIGSVRVQPGTGRSVDVDVYFRGSPSSRHEFDRMLRDFALEVTQEGPNVRVNGIFRGGWEPMSLSTIFGSFGNFGNLICRNGRCLEYSSWLREVEFSVTVPHSFNVGIATSGGAVSVEDLKGEVEARTSGGRITLAGVKGRTDIHTSGGAIRISDVAGDLNAATSGGSIVMDRVTGRIHAHTSGGRIEAREITGAIDASTSGGSVTAALLAQPGGDCRLASSGGGIYVSLPRDVRVDLDASASGGSVSTDFPVPASFPVRRNREQHHERELRAPLNGGGPLLYLHTSGGSIRVRSAT